MNNHTSLNEVSHYYVFHRLDLVVTTDGILKVNR